MSMQASSATRSEPQPREQRRAAAVPAARIRDPRLDFFRGLTMFIILIAHVPNDWFALWIPARFGFSDATEVFVFCSGMASAIAFGSVFRDRGLAMGTARVAHRVWQVYWVHIAQFLVLASLLAAVDLAGWFERGYVAQLNLVKFFANAAPNLIGLFTLTYVPNYFDILPMYLVILAMMPFMVALAGISRWLVFAAMGTIWLMAGFAGWNFPAEPWSSRVWFFNPMGWQLVFFTGFAFMSGWLPAPPVRGWLIWLAVAVLLISVPFAYFRIINLVPAIQHWRADWAILITKTDFGILRYVHFLALAYLAWVAVGPKGSRLTPPEAGGMGADLWRGALRVIMKVGQQSLPVFASSLIVAQLMGIALDEMQRSWTTSLIVNVAGFGAIIAVAYTAGWFKSQPWRGKGGSAHAAS